MRDIDAGVQREPAGPGGAVGVSFQSLQSSRHGLQREQLLACSWTHGDAVGDRVTQQVVQWTGHVPRQPRVLAVALDDAGLLQQRADAGGNALDQRLQILRPRLGHGALRLSPEQMQALNAITVAELRRETEDSLQIMSRTGCMDPVSASRLRVETVTRQHKTLLRILEKATPQLTPELSNMMSSMFALWQ